MKNILLKLSPLIILILFGVTVFSTEGIAGENYAFLVAVGDYDVKHLNPLAYTRNDILEFRTELLKSGFPKENIVLLHDDLKQLENRRYLPEAEKIRQEFTLLVSGLEPDDTLIVAMAGHGVQFKDGESSYFCPADADLDDEKHASLISFSELYRGLEQCEARKKLLLIDACRNNPQSQLSRSRAKVELQSITRPQSEPIPEGIVALFSCSAGEQAYEWPDLKHGIFFHHVLEGWKGAADDGDLSLSLDELVAYTRKKTQTFARLKLGSIQRPQRLGEFSGTWKLCEIEDPDYELGLKLYMGDGVLMDRGRAYQLFRKAADRGHTLAKTFVGLSYAKGDYGIQQDLSEANRWFESAMPALRTLADDGNPIAQNNLGDMYYEGHAVPKDVNEAVKWYRASAGQNYPAAQNNLGFLYGSGEGVEKSYSEALKWYRKSASQDYAPAQDALGYSYYSGWGVEQNKYEAVKWYRKAANQSYAEAQNKIGKMYYDGEGVGKSYSQAVKWFQEAAEQNHLEAQTSLGSMLKNGWGCDKNINEAVKWYRKAAERDYAYAQVYLGVMYEFGTGVKQNDHEAIRWFRKAAEQDNAEGLNKLAFMYVKGRGVEQDKVKAFQLSNKAATLGLASAQYNVGYCYSQGIGIEKNRHEAFRWYQKAAEQNHLTAQWVLGDFYQDGDVVEKNYSKAVLWYRKAAEQNDAIAQNRLGVMYKKGNGVAKDYAEAAKWYRKAMKGSDPSTVKSARANLKQIGYSP
ncbi:MAG: caspase family protein [Gimesia chilikensis]|uniref:caspase family protein n=1 Tax=Gimesia chilikensis TaxID=2605989 RepID=UPI00378B82F4